MLNTNSVSSLLFRLRTNTRMIGLAMLAAVFLNIAIASASSAATITVNTTNMTSTREGTAAPGECSIIDAFRAANTDTVVGDCVAGEPGLDLVVLPAGNFDFNDSASFDRLNTPFWAASIEGVSASQTKVVNVKIGAIPMDAGAYNYSLSNFSLESGGIYVENGFGSGATSASINMQDMDVVHAWVYVRQGWGFSVDTNIENVNFVADTSDNIPHDDVLFTQIEIMSEDSLNTHISMGNTTIRNVTMDGGGVNGRAIYHHIPTANAVIKVENSIIKDYKMGVVNKECASDSFSVSSNPPSDMSMYITNSQISGLNMETGIHNICGHVVVNATTLKDIAGSAILANTNHVTRHFDSDEVTYYPQLSSNTEVRNSTFTNITPKPGEAVVMMKTESNPDNPAQVPVTNSELLMQHNTFASNNLSSGSEIGVTNQTTLKSLTLQNNAVEGKPLAGNFSVSGTQKVANNMTTADYTGPSQFSSAFTKVPNFILGPLQDNGGMAPIGVNGSFGNVLTMRPLSGSPLIDGAPSAGLTIDQRNQVRSQMGSFDIGAVEVREAEFTADGGTWTGGGGSSNPSNPPRQPGSPETSTDGRLADTGGSVWLAVIAGSVATMAGVGLVARRVRG